MSSLGWWWYGFFVEALMVLVAVLAGWLLADVWRYGWPACGRCY